MAIVLFGLTGGIGSGKSVVAARWREAGLPVLDADRIAREVVEPETVGHARVIEHFGPGVCAADGGLDRAALGAMVFADPEARRALEDILHPLIRERALALAAALDGRGEPIACYEAALLVESGLGAELRPLVVVAASAAVQIERLRARDGLSREQARRRLEAQRPLDEKIAMADYVIDNDGPLERTLARADEVLVELRASVREGRLAAGAQPSLARARPEPP